MLYTGFQENRRGPPIPKTFSNWPHRAPMGPITKMMTGLSLESREVQKTVILMLLQAPCLLEMAIFTYEFKSALNLNPG